MEIQERIELIRQEIQTELSRYDKTARVFDRSPRTTNEQYVWVRRFNEMERRADHIVELEGQIRTLISLL